MMNCPTMHTKEKALHAIYYRCLITILYGFFGIQNFTLAIHRALYWNISIGSSLIYNHCRSYIKDGKQRELTRGENQIPCSTRSIIQPSTREIRLREEIPTGLRRKNRRIGPQNTPPTVRYRINGLSEEAVPFFHAELLVTDVWRCRD